MRHETITVGNLCVHCFGILTEVTRDHVFPRGWYTDDTSERVQRWTVPSCPECNHRYGVMENALFLRLALCTDPSKAEASGITEKLRRSLGVGLGTEKLSCEELQKRIDRRDKILEETIPYPSAAKPFPGLGPHPGVPRHMQRAIPVPEELLKPVMEKIFRGVEYMVGKRYIHPPYKLKVIFVEQEPKIVTDIFKQSGFSVSLGPGFVIHRASSPDLNVVYKVIIWGSLVAYAYILKPVENETTKQHPVKVSHLSHL